MTLEEYQKLLQHHDWYYYFSDDHRVWLRGEEASARIVALAKAGPDDFKRAYNEAHARHFNNEDFGKSYKIPFPEVVNSSSLS